MYISQRIAAETIQQVFAGSNLTSSLALALKHYADVTPQQRAVAQDLSYGTLRFYGQVNALLSQLLEKPLQDERLRCLLLVAIYQLQYDKASQHTVVNEAVKAASQFKKTWMRGLVNGVLRNFLRRQNELQQHIANDEVAEYSYPMWWITKLKEQYPAHWRSILVAGNIHPPMTLRVNLRQTSLKKYADILKTQSIEHSIYGDTGIMLDKALPVERIPAFVDGHVSVQDFGAQFSAHFLDISSGMRVLDACCAPGGKTGHLLESADIHLVAIDSDATRLNKVADNLKRLKLNADLKLGDAAGREWWDGVLFDRILADVPCTASGIVRRHVDIKWLRRHADIASFMQQQAAILPSLWQVLAKGGKLLYVTCSIFHEENQRQIDSFLKNQADAIQLPLTSIEQLNLQQVNIENGQLLPCKQHDGFFYALLQKE